MELDEFREYLKNIVENADLEYGSGKTQIFAETAAKMMQEAEYLNGDFQESFYTGTNPKNRRSMRVDGYIQDEADGTLALFAVHFTEDGGNLTKELAEKNFKMLESFASAAAGGLIKNADESSSAAELIGILQEKNYSGLKFFLLTNAQKISTLTAVKSFRAAGFEAECQIWDVERIFQIYKSQQLREPVVVDFLKYGAGIPCLRCAEGSYESFLCVISGETLADIYDEYGSRLLEGNVRSFLSTKRAVNKKIRASIIHTPDKFFALNNGISAVVESLSVEDNLITAAADFQIINGGQTTASLSSARFKDKAELAGIFLQMKITIIGSMAAEKREELIQEIARSSNSQNKVSDADFFSTHPFHVAMEEISRRIFAPAANGEQYQTHWFYERARGQYLQEQMRLTQAQKKKFQRENPKPQVMTKTDFAKYRMSWDEKPDTVSKGTQANFMKFAEMTEAAWNRNRAQFNEYYFKETAALAILFSSVEKLVSRQSWYNSYRANIVTYSLALFHFLLRKKFPDMELDLIEIWKNQALPPVLEEIFEDLTLRVNDFITDSGRPTANVTQWCKQNLCWERMKAAVDADFPKSLGKILKSSENLTAERKTARAEQKNIDKISAMIKVVEMGGGKWRELGGIVSRDKIGLTSDEKSALKLAVQIPQKTPNEFQCAVLLRMLERLKENGLEL